jgi:hypothetical protein
MVGLEGPLTNEQLYHLQWRTILDLRIQPTGTSTTYQQWLVEQSRRNARDIQIRHSTITYFLTNRGQVSSQTTQLITARIPQFYTILNHFRNRYPDHLSSVPTDLLQRPT